MKPNFFNLAFVTYLATLGACAAVPKIDTASVPPIDPEESCEGCTVKVISNNRVAFKGYGEVRYAGRAPTAEQIQKAEFQAKANGLMRYVSKQRSPLTELFSNCVLTPQQWVQLMPESRSIPVAQQKEIYRVALRSTIDVTTFDEYLTQCLGPVPQHRIAIILVARQKVPEQQRSVYKIFLARLDQALAQSFAHRHFTVDSNRDMELKAGGLYRKIRLMEQYKTAGQVNWESAFIASDLNEIDLLVLGTVDVGEVNKVQLNGMDAVSVKASAEILDLNHKTVVAATETIQRRGEEPTEDQAIDVAVQQVVNALGQDLIDRLMQHYMISK